jgi:hypothetical protein
MQMNDIFIALGYHCNITFLTKQLNIHRETGLFEWFECRKLQHLTDIVNIIKNGINTDIIKYSGNGICINHHEVFTFHYKLEDYKPIFERRAKRFLDIIKNSSELIFVRLNPTETQREPIVKTTIEEINNFCDAIKSINSELKIKFLLVNTIENESVDWKLDETKLIPNVFLLQRHLKVSDVNGDHYHTSTNEKLNAIFEKYMQEIGYNTSKVYKQISDED